MREPKCPIANMRCPRNNDPERGAYCPAWTEYAETNAATGEERVTKECMFQALPRFMVEVVRASNRPAAAVESTRNELAKGFAEVTQAMHRMPEVMAQRQIGRDGYRDAARDRLKRAIDEARRS